MPIPTPNLVPPPPPPNKEEELLRLVGFYGDEEINQIKQFAVECDLSIAALLRTSLRHYQMEVLRLTHPSKFSQIKKSKPNG